MLFVNLNTVIRYERHVIQTLLFPSPYESFTWKRYDNRQGRILRVRFE